MSLSRRRLAGQSFDLMVPYHYSPEIAEFFRSVEVIWLVWVISLALFLVLTIYGLRSLGKISLRDIRVRLCGLIHDESGASYSLSFAMVFPIYVLIIALILEATFMLVAKMGTMYAAFGAARSAIVWTTVEKPNDRQSMRTSITGKSQKMAQQAAIQAMVPFASGLHPGNSSTSQAANDYLKAYKAYTDGATKKPLRAEYIIGKYNYAAGSVRTSLSGVRQGEFWKEDIVATVSYDAPFLLPYIGKLLGGKERTVNGVKVTCLTIQSKAALLTECPMNDTGSLGISYATAK